MRSLCVAAAVGAAAAILAAGCGGSGVSYTVDSDNLKELSRQGRLSVYDAENGIVVALDRLDEAKDSLREIRRQIDDAEKAVERAEKRNKRLGVEVAEAWLGYLEAREKWAEENIDLQRTGITVARALVELAKAQAINREDLLGGKDFDMEDYKEQYEELRAEQDEQRKRVDALRKKARKREKNWWTLRRRFVAQTGDYDSGLWID